MYRFLCIILFLFISISSTNASFLNDKLKDYIEKPYTLGKKDKKIPVWEVLDKNKKLHSYIFETYDYAHIPGFSGGKMNLLVQIDLKGNFLDIKVLEQDEPVFVSGLGLEPFVNFLKQYKGKSLKESIKIKVPRGQSSPIHIDGITKATASVYIANDLILGSSVQVAKEKLFNTAPKKIYHAKKDLYEKYSWQELLDKKLITHLKVTKGQMEKLFIDTQYEKKLSADEKNNIALDLYLADINIPSVSKNLFKQITQDEINEGLEKTNEGILVFANGEYEFISQEFVPNTSPSELEIKQDSFSLNIIDGNYDIEFLKGVPSFSQTMLLAVDKRYDFDPSSLWTLKVKIIRGGGNILSSPITRFLSIDVKYPKKYFNIPKAKSKTKKEAIKKELKNIPILKDSNNKAEILSNKESKEERKIENKEAFKEELKQELKKELKQEILEELLYKLNQDSKKQMREKLEEEKRVPFWLQTIYNQKIKFISLLVFLLLLFITLFKYKSILKKLRYKRTIILTFTLFFIGWYGQGQLSIVTVIGVIRSIYNSQTISFLLYDPFSLIIWFFVFLSLVIWGRGTFCGWLCPYGILQEFSFYLGKILKFPRIILSDNLNSKLVYLKYFILAALILSIFFETNITKYLVEIEPFKTSITFIFNRELPYVLYALFWILLSMFLFKGFCRYICPLGAFLSLLGQLRILNWLPRRVECGNPCNNCFKNCNYQAINKKDGHINYTDCFQCMDCIQIYSDEKLCKILIKDIKKEKEIKISKWSTKNA